MAALNFSHYARNQIANHIANTRYRQIIALGGISKNASELPNVLPPSSSELP